MSGVTLGSWHRLWRELGASAGDEATFNALVAAYSEKHRHYHTLQHLRECLEHFEQARALAPNPAQAELALWFHDAVYDVHAADNEARSAEWGARCVRQAGLPQAVADRVHALVMATQHKELPQQRDAQVVVDADLAILGAEPPRFEQSDRQIRAEYAHVPAPEFRVGRCRVLRRFLDRPRIYATDLFFSRYEASARRNLRASLETLSCRA